MSYHLRSVLDDDSLVGERTHAATMTDWQTMQGDCKSKRYALASLGFLLAGRRSLNSKRRIHTNMTSQNTTAMCSMAGRRAKECIGHSDRQNLLRFYGCSR